MNYNDFGLWLMAPLFLRHIKAMEASAEEIKAMQTGGGFERVGNIAVISIIGAMSKGLSWYGGTSTLQVREQLARAVADDSVSGILLDIDSPGGNVSGTKELADAVKMASKKKLVYAQISDLGASASYWVASQASKIFINEMGEVGSIGTVAVVEDYSEAYKEAGIKVHVISTGALKGAFASGSEVTQEMIDDLQKRVNDINFFFLEAVSTGRKIKLDKLEAIATGAVYSAKEGLKLKLVDAVQSIDDTMQTMGALVSSKPSVRKRTEVFNRLKSAVEAEPSKQ